MTLRTRLEAGGCLAAPGVHDGLSARLASDAGAEALYLGGNALGLALGKGQPFVTLTETAEAVRRVRAVADLPVIVDAGAGFGDPAHVRVAVRELEAAGAAAIHIDDQPYPKPASYHRGAGRLAETATVATRLKVAAAARRSSDMMLIARTDALRVTGDLCHAVARGRAFLAAGAEALMILDLTPEQAPVVRQELPDARLVWIGGVNPPVPTVQALTEAGFAMALYPFNGVAATTIALNDLWRGFYSEGAPGQSDALLARARKETATAADLSAAWAIEDEYGA
jgi:methylisocitrate lyase